ncbi:TetR/AcrR family transcriptional regulator [Bacillus sp. AGMB 02131]|uniref:TetR/AcrR family transcriptional regulator n=1 Tax=Peribacillus faecalis TaxID=2772559 RepID=A0A927CVY1_9BACI|nr:TetR/AcrR family transcriptional regulator [Peribacillus faecalis]MBD3107757.1 TetR/AcrR family transcriptional regulator [Peribacillus faecalis]
MAGNKREDILNSALHLFSERGYDGTTVPMIADQAKVGTGTIYRYFDNKEYLVNCLFQECVQKFSDAVITYEFSSQNDIKQQFNVFFFKMVEYAKNNPQALQFIESHWRGHYLDNKSEEMFEQFLNFFRSFAENGKRAGILRPLPEDAFIAIVYGAFTHLFKLVRIGMLRDDQHLYEEVADCCWNAIRIL